MTYNSKREKYSIHQGASQAYVVRGPDGLHVISVGKEAKRDATKVLAGMIALDKLHEEGGDSGD